MNTNKYEQPEMIINLKEVIWDLLEQWKAVLITALALMVLLAGAKYYKDTNAYENALKRSSKMEQTGNSTKERVEDVLKSLSDDEQATVEYIANQNKWLEEQKEYMNKSILMNTNPTNQRTLLVDYYISMEDASESKMTAILYGYAGYLSNDNLIKNVGKVIDPNADSKYIAELISVNGDKQGNSSSNGNGISLVIDSDADGVVMETRVVLPDSADAAAVEKALTNTLEGYSSELRSKIGGHSIRLIKSTEAYVFNSAAVNNHNNIMNNIYNLYNASKNLQSSLSDEQKAALEAVTTINSETEAVTNGEKAPNTSGVNKETKQTKPGISKKYAMLGFVLGAMAYAFVYLLLTVIRGRVNYASDASTYTQSRLLGEIYRTAEYKGLSKLLHSSLVSKYRYGGKMDSEVQTEKTINSLLAACEHADSRSISVLNMTGSDDSDILKSIQKKAKKEGLTLNETAVDSDVNERNLLAIDKALMILSNESKVSDAIKMTELCKDYDKDILGSIYIGEI